jgi:hypothetical protein
LRKPLASCDELQLLCHKVGRLYVFSCYHLAIADYLKDNMLAFSRTKRKYSYIFHMVGGNQIICHNVVKLVMTSNPNTGRYSAYEIEWAKNCSPNFFSLVISDIQAVTTVQ